MMPNGFTVFSTLLLLFAAVAKAGCPISPGVPFTSSQRTYAGEYKNLSYGYSVMIPHGLRGVDTDNPAYQKGAAAELALFKEEGLQLADERIASTELGGHAAETLSFRYACSGQEPEYLHVEVMALSQDGQYIYTIAWDGASNIERLDQQVISALKRSWRMFAPK